MLPACPRWYGSAGEFDSRPICVNKTTKIMVAIVALVLLTGSKCTQDGPGKPDKNFTPESDHRWVTPSPGLATGKQPASPNN